MKMPWNSPEKPAKTGEPNLKMEAAPSAAEVKAPSRRRLYVWAESPEQRHKIDGMFSHERWAMMPTSHTGPELVKLLRTGNPAGIVFHYDKGLQTVLDDLRLLETGCPEVVRLVVCPETCQDTFRDWKGIPPTVLTEGATQDENEDKLARAITLNQWLTQPIIRGVLPRLQTIPTLPAAHQRIVEALRDPNFSAEGIARLMSQDIALTTNLFKAVNSASFALSQPIQSAQDAITYLGVQRLQALVMSAWAFKFIDEKTCQGSDPQKEWEHAMAVANAAQDLARALWAPAALREAAFTAGMLHDLGKLLLAANAPDAYSLILADARESGKPLWQVEKEDMGFSHAEIGGCMLGIWGVAVPVMEAVAWHHQPSLSSNQQLSPLTLVHVANCKVRGIEPDATQSRLAMAP